MIDEGIKDELKEETRVVQDIEQGDEDIEEVESYRNSTLNNILDDIAKKYKIDTSKERLRKDVHIQEIKFKYRTYAECIRILYKNVGLTPEA